MDEPESHLRGSALSMLIGVVCLVGAWGVGADASAQPIRSRLFVQEYGAAPLVVASVSIARGEETLDARPMALREGEDYRVAIRWLVDGAIAESKTEIRISFIGSGPTIASTHTVDTAGWGLGELRESSLGVQYPRLRCSGRATLFVDWIPSKDGAPVRLWAEPVFVEAVAGKTRVDARAMSDVFLVSSSVLDRSFRLGVGASITLELPKASREGIDLLGVASFTNYDNESRSGEAVAELIFEDDAGRVSGRRILRSGLHTAKTDHDEYPPGMLRTRRIHIFESFESGTVSRYSNEPYDVHIYGALVPFDRPIDATRVTVRYLRDYGTFQVESIALHTKAYR